MRPVALVLACCALLLAAFVGCSSDRPAQVLAPAAVVNGIPHNVDGSTYVPPGMPAGGTWTWVDATHVKYSVMASRYDPHLAKITIGPIEVVYVCDYPMDFIGPLPAGHCRTDGSGCS